MEREETQRFETGSPETESAGLQFELIFVVIVICPTDRQEAGDTLQVNMCPKNPEE